MTDCLNEKKELRNIMKTKLMDLSKKTLESFERSRQAFEFFSLSSIYKESKTLLVFMSTELEINTKSLIEKAISDKKDVAIPRTTNGKMDFYFLNPSIPMDIQLEQGEYGIRVPITTLKKLQVNKLPICTSIIIPGLAFSETGERLGHGKGFYDRFIAEIYEKNNRIHLPLALVGYGYSFQLIKSVPVTPTDIPLTHIVTDSGVLTL